MEHISPCLSYYLTLCLYLAAPHDFAVSHCMIASISLLLPVIFLSFPIGIWDYAPYWCLEMRTIGLEEGERAVGPWSEHQQWQQIVTSKLSACHQSVWLLLTPWDFYCNFDANRQPPSKKLSLKLSRVCQYAALDTGSWPSLVFFNLWR